jgi:hypothetical protein
VVLGLIWFGGLNWFGFGDRGLVPSWLVFPATKTQSDVLGHCSAPHSCVELATVWFGRAISEKSRLGKLLWLAA